VHPTMMRRTAGSSETSSALVHRPAKTVQCFPSPLTTRRPPPGERRVRLIYTQWRSRPPRTLELTLYIHHIKTQRAEPLAAGVTPRGGVCESTMSDMIGRMIESSNSWHIAVSLQYVSNLWEWLGGDRSHEMQPCEDQYEHGRTMPPSASPSIPSTPHHSS
jgi:hypothetical protein